MTVSAANFAEMTAKVASLKQEIESLKTGGNPMTNADLDTLWLMLCAIVVFFMQTGFTMLECGSCRSKNVVNIVFKNSMDACCAALTWWAVGWALAYGGDTVAGGRNVFIGGGEFFLASSGHFPNTAFAGWFFQWAFAATTATIISGAIAERCTVKGYIIVSIVMTALIYPVVVHWVWSGAGWLSAFCDTTSFGRVGTHGMIDFAGSGVVHLTGGVGAFVGALIIGPRRGRFGPSEESAEEKQFRENRYRPHNQVLICTGTLILWLGWYGFNAGSTLMLSANASLIAAKVCVTTTLAAGAGGITTVLMSRMFMGHFDVNYMMNGILGGLVSVTAPCSVVEPWAAAVIGVIGGVVFYGFSRLLLKLKIDDVLCASGVHGACGIWGVIAVGLFATKENLVSAYGATDPTVYGLFYGGGGEQLGVQLLGIVAILVWVGALSALVFGVLKVTGQLRVKAEEEDIGLDRSEHGGGAFQLGSPRATPPPMNPLKVSPTAAEAEEGRIDVQDV
jgi:Amt family ammonium transporter